MCVTGHFTRINLNIDPINAEGAEGGAEDLVGRQYIQRVRRNVANGNGAMEYDPFELVTIIKVMIKEKMTSSRGRVCDSWGRL